MLSQAFEGLFRAFKVPTVLPQEQLETLWPWQMLMDVQNMCLAAWHNDATARPGKQCEVKVDTHDDSRGGGGGRPSGLTGGPCVL